MHGPSDPATPRGSPPELRVGADPPTAGAFDAFISYRRSDGAAMARRIRRTLQDYRPPRALRARASGRLKVYLDTAYERATNDFFEGTTLPALLASRHLVVVVTPDVVDRGPGERDWIRREIEAFEGGPNAGNVVVVRGAGPDDVPLPPGVARRYPNVEVVDLRGLSPFTFLNPTKAARLADERVKLVGPMLGFAADDMPALRREEERRQQARLGSAVGVTAAVMLAVVALSIVALRSVNQATEALTRSSFAADRFVQAVAGSMAPSDVRSQLLTTGCDLLDSLKAGAGRDAGSGAVAACSVERAARHEAVGERERADRLLASAEEEVERRLAASGRVDDGLALLDLMLARLEREGAGAEPAVVRFVSRVEVLANESPAGSDLAVEGADALRTAAVRLGEARRWDPGLAAARAGAVMRAVAGRRKPSASIALEAIADVGLRAALLVAAGRLPQARAALDEADRALAAVGPDDIRSAGLDARSSEVRDMLAGVGKDLDAR